MSKQMELQALADAKGVGQVGFRPAGGQYPLSGWYILGPKPIRLGFNVSQAKKKLSTATPNVAS